MNPIIRSALKQALVIVVIVVAAGLLFNSLRKDGIPLIAEAETFRVETDAEFLKVADARRLFDEGNAIFIDARDPELFRIERIEGALSMPPAGSELEAADWIPGTGSSVICYASERSQRQAGVVADRLIGLGTEKVFVLYGGLDAWKAEGLPTETD